MSKDYLSFAKARTFTRRLGLKSFFEWRMWFKDEGAKHNIPSSPHLYYRDHGWNGWGDFLGTNTKRKIPRDKFLPFSKARAFARKLKLKDSRAWRKWCKEGERPDNIPSAPNVVYKNKGWTTWGDFLGNDRGRYNRRHFLSNEQAKAYMATVKLQSYEDWRIWCKEGKRPADIPSSPEKHYQGAGWIDWKHFLGVPKPERRSTKKKVNHNRNFLPFHEAREYVRSIGIKSFKEWNVWSTSGQRPANIPSNPNTVYRGKGWISFRDFWGIESKPAKARRYLTYMRARQIVWSQGFSNPKEFKQWAASGEIPNNIPVNPDIVYKDSGWNGWTEFLRNGANSKRKKRFLPFHEAREFARKLNFTSSYDWIAWCRRGERPKYIPSSPYATYKNSGWKGWADFLGYNNKAKQ